MLDHTQGIKSKHLHLSVCYVCTVHTYIHTYIVWQNNTLPYVYDKAIQYHTNSISMHGIS